MKALVTGATGFIGGVLARRLVEGGWDVRCLVRATSRPDKLSALRVELVAGDVRDAEAVSTAVEGVDAVFHCAALVDVLAPTRKTILDINVEGTRNVLRSCRTARVRRVVYLSSVAALGMEHTGTVDERTPHPEVYRSRYDESKHKSELVAQEFASKGLDVVMVLPSIVIGPGDPKTGRLIKGYLRQRIPALVRPDGRHGYVHVEDLVEGILLAYEKGRGGERYIFNQVNWTSTQLLMELEKVSGVPPPRLRVPAWLAAAGAGLITAGAWVARKPSPLTPGFIRMSTRNFSYSSEKARRELGWEPADFVERLAQTLQWYMDREGRRGQE